MAKTLQDAHPRELRTLLLRIAVRHDSELVHTKPVETLDDVVEQRPTLLAVSNGFKRHSSALERVGPHRDRASAPAR